MSGGRAMLVLAKAPGISRPSLLSTSNCMRVLPDAASTERDDASTMPLKVLPGYSGTVIDTLLLSFTAGT